MRATIANTIACTIVTKVYSSGSLFGMNATMLAAQSTELGINDIIVAGCIESVSNVPKYIVQLEKIAPASMNVFLKIKNDPEIDQAFRWVLEIGMHMF